jgi:hypothetical protein
MAAAGPTTYVLVTMNSDRVLSLLSGTVPGQISWNSTFAAQLFTVMLPVLGFLTFSFRGNLRQHFHGYRKPEGTSVELFCHMSCRKSPAVRFVGPIEFPIS